MMRSKVQLGGLTSIVAIDADGAIGCRNALPWTLKTDLAFFRRETTGNSVIMGRKTYDSIGKCLPKRSNIILSHNNVLFSGTDDCQLALSVDEALYRAAVNNRQHTFVIGGALTYQQFASFVDRYLVTVVDVRKADADTFLDPVIISEFNKWDRKLLMSYPACQGQDQYSFSVYEIEPLDKAQRRERLADAVNRYAECLVRSAKKVTRGKLPPRVQDAFAF